MDWEVPTEAGEDGQDFDPSGDDRNYVNTVGRYHVQVTAVDDDNPKSPEQLVVDYEVLGGRRTGQEGRTFRDYFAPSLKARNRIMKWAIACGITTEAAAKKAAEERRPLTLHPRDAIGRQLIIDVEQGEKQDGTPRLECNWGIYSLDSPEAEGVVNKGMLQAAGDASEDLFGDAGGSEGNDGAAAGQSKEGSSVKDDEFGDLF